MSAAVEFAKLRVLPATQALDYLAQRGALSTTYSWQDLWNDEHAHQFTISRLTRLDLLASLRDGITRSVQGDLSRKDWIKDTEKLLTDAGWWGKKEVIDPATGEILTTRFDSARLKLIYDTNTRQAYAAGLWERVERNKVTHPYVRYITKQDERVRASHRPWNSLTLPVDDAFWRTHWPPNGWRCRCRVMSMSQREYDRGMTPSGEPLKTVPPPVDMLEHVNQRTGEITQVPRGIDPGFGYNAGMARQRAQDKVLADKLASTVPELAQAARQARLMCGLPAEPFTGQRPGLFELPPIHVTSLSGEEFGAGLSHVELMKRAEAALRELQGSDGLVNEDTGWLLTVNKKSREKMGDNKAQSRPSLQAVADLKVLVQRAVVAERHDDVKHQNRNVQAIYRLFVPVEIAGKLYRVKLTVKDLVAPDNVSKLLHALETAEIESAPLGTLPAAVTAGDSITGQGQPTTGRVITIADLLAGAQTSQNLPFQPQQP